MRIVYLHQYFNLPSAAGSTRSYEMARRLVAWGHEVYMVTSDRTGRGRRKASKWWESVEEGIRVHWLPIPYSNEMPYGDRIRAFARFALGAARRAAGLPADVVFATSTPLTIALPGIWAARRQHVPFVFEVRDLWPAKPIAIGALRSRSVIRIARWLERFAYRNASRIVALSPSIASAIRETQYPPDRLHIIPNASDLGLFAVSATAKARFRASLPWLGDRPLVVYTGTIGRVNGVDYLVRLAASMWTLAPHIRFLIVGDGGERARVERLAADLNVLNKSLFMMGPMPKREIPGVLAAADLATSLVIDLPGFAADSANKVFDALAAGRPVAVNYGGWLSDLLVKHGAGMILNYYDISHAAHQVFELLASPGATAEAGRAARRLAEQRFSRDDLARELEAALFLAVGCTSGVDRPGMRPVTSEL